MRCPPMTGRGPTSGAPRALVLTGGAPGLSRARSRGRRGAGTPARRGRPPPRRGGAPPPCAAALQPSPFPEPWLESLHRVRDPGVVDLHRLDIARPLPSRGRLHVGAQREVGRDIDELL